MDVDSLRSIMTVVSFVTFAGIVVWAWSGRMRPSFDRAALAPFEEDGQETPR